MAKTELLASTWDSAKILAIIALKSDSEENKQIDQSVIRQTTNQANVFSKRHQLSKSWTTHFTEKNINLSKEQARAILIDITFLMETRQDK